MATLDPNCPVDRRIMEREAEKKQERQKQEVQQLWQKANTHAWNEWFAERFEVEMGDQDGVFMQAVGQVICDLRRDYRPKIAALEARVKATEEKAALDQKFFDLERRLDARQLARDESKRGPKGARGDRGERGERGHRGDPGPPGEPAKQPLIVGWKVDAHDFRAVPFGPDGRPLPALDLRPMFQAILDVAVDEARRDVREIEQLLTRMALSHGL